MSQYLHVVLGILENNQKFLVAQRRSRSHLAGQWEFAGGKVHPDETYQQALNRELWEELDIVVEKAHPLITITHRYSDRCVELHVWKVTQYGGIPRGAEQQLVRWVSVKQLKELAFVAANQPIIHALQLPTYYPITGYSEWQQDAFLAHLKKDLQRGARLVQLRASHFSEKDYLLLSERAYALCHDYGAQLMLKGDPSWLSHVSADGLHLTSQQLMSYTKRPICKSKWLAASCHTLQELKQAHVIDADFVVVSPVLPTSCHPESVHHYLGWDTLSAWIKICNFPVYALGGMRQHHQVTAWQQGAQGISGRQLYESIE